MHHALLLGGFLAAALAVPALAAEPVKITATVLVEKREAAADGTTRVRLVPVGRIVPGDHVVYRLSVSNSGSKPASGVVIANPIPAGMQYAGPAANSPVPELSVDGKTFGSLGSLRIATADGKTRAAAPADVRVVRWHLAQPVAPGGEGQVAFRALLK